MRAAVVVFPGSNCDADALHVLNEVAGIKADFVWHTETDLDGYDVIVLPGGFSYGDYLRSGAVAAVAPVMGAVSRVAARGVAVLGICNGFQVLLESGLLPGAMLHNTGIDFRCEWIHLRVERTRTPVTGLCTRGDVLRLPIAHGEGNYQASSDLLARLHDEDRVVFRYSDAEGMVTRAANPNGSVANIAGICNQAGNVVGLMPHPERASEAELGSTDGRVFWESLLAMVPA
jgi:phosphoribosylformylglycinamidine synthase subunit PurQ / glutaminase